MKRRAILAGLLVVALAPIVVAVVSSGGGGQEAQITKGTPFRGESGVTRTVAWIKTRQEYLDRHPEIAEAQARADAAQEAAREEALGEQGRAEGEEGQPPSQEEQPRSVEGKAASEAGPRSGEADLAAGALSGTNIREKPEPGEGGLPQKRPGPSIGLQRVGSAAITTPKQAVNPSSTNFLGAQSSDSGFVPPDSMGAIGPSQVVVDVNGRLRVFDKEGNPSGLDVTDSAFWAPVRNGAEPTDPGVEYDRLSQRWVVSAITIEPTNNRIMLAVSNGPTITSTSNFTYFFFSEASPPPSGPSRFADYPQLGVDANAIYIGVNEFTSSSGGFTGTTAFVIRKSSVMGGGPIVVTAFRNLASGSGAGPASPQPATDMVPSVDSGYIVGADNAFFSRLDVRRISDPGGTPSISPNLTVTVPQTFVPTSTPFAVPAQGTIGGLDALDDRLFEATISRDPNGNVTLWTAHNLLVNSTGASSASGNRAGDRWYQLGNLDTTPSLVQSGTLFDTAAPNPRQFWIPSIVMNGQGHASINASAAGTTHHAEVASSGRLFTDPLGTIEPSQISQSSTSTYNLGSGTPHRWGDYSQTVVDPTDNMTFWTFQEYANATDSWGVQVIKLLAPPPADPSTATPSTVPLGACSAGVDVVGTSTDGSGFFDPGPDPGGPGYPSHITASVTGGVAVNGVTYTDPTHITLDLDTRSATSGPQDVTITNPDGQSVTATGLITVDTPGSGPTTPCLNGTTPDSPANNNNPKIFGTADAGSTVTLYTDAGCSGTAVGAGTGAQFAAPGISVDPVSDNSSTTYYATATDSGSNVSACSSTLSTPSDSVTYIEDSIPPVPSVDSGPSGLTNDTTPTFSFSATDAIGPISFECSIDTGTPSFRACSGPANTDTPGSPLADGPYTFRAQATDGAGNSAVATRSFSVQVSSPPPTPPTKVAPDTTITKGPKKTRKTRPKFKFTSTDPAATFRCKLDKGPFVACTSPFVTPKLRPGKHKLKVIAIGSGGTDSTPAVRKFRVLPPG
jgi:hypothetical protein